MAQGQKTYREYIEDAKVRIRELLEKETVMYVTEIRVRLDGSIDPAVRFWHWITYDALQEMYRNGELRRRPRRGTFYAEYDGIDEPIAKKGSDITFYWPTKYTYGDIRDILVKKLDVINALSSKSKRMGHHAEELVEEALHLAKFEVTCVTSASGTGIRRFRDKEWTGKHDLDFVVYGSEEDRWYGIQLKNTLSYTPWDDVAGLIDICAFFGIKP